MKASLSNLIWSILSILRSDQKLSLWRYHVTNYRLSIIKMPQYCIANCQSVNLRVTDTDLRESKAGSPRFRLGSHAVGPEAPPRRAYTPEAAVANNGGAGRLSISGLGNFLDFIALARTRYRTRSVCTLQLHLLLFLSPSICTLSSPPVPSGGEQERCTRCNCAADAFRCALRTSLPRRGKAVVFAADSIQRYLVSQRSAACAWGILRTDCSNLREKFPRSLLAEQPSSHGGMPMAFTMQPSLRGTRRLVGYRRFFWSLFLGSPLVTWGPVDFVTEVGTRWQGEIWEGFIV